MNGVGLDSRLTENFTEVGATVKFFLSPFVKQNLI